MYEFVDEKNCEPGYIFSNTFPALHTCTFCFLISEMQHGCSFHNHYNSLTAGIKIKTAQTEF
jgi:hypothetical protein